jgi:sugar lactone lactonase YvrE
MGYGYNIYFTERVKNRVIRWNPDSDLVKIVAGEGVTGLGKDQHLHDPYGLAIDGTGHLLIADKQNHRLVRLTNQLEKIKTLDVNGSRGTRLIPRENSPVTPTSIFPCSDGTYVVSYSDDYTIYRVHANGNLELLLGVPPSTPSAFRGYFPTIAQSELALSPIYQPTSAIVLADGRIMYIERGYQAVRIYTHKEGVRALFAQPHLKGNLLADSLPCTLPFEKYSPTFPTSLTIDNQGSVYLSDAAQRSIWYVDLQNSQMRLVTRTGGKPGRGGGPSAIACGPDGTIWVMDYGEGIVFGMAKSSSGWQRVPAMCTTIYESLSCTANEGAGIVCSVS